MNNLIINEFPFANESRLLFPLFQSNFNVVLHTFTLYFWFPFQWCFVCYTYPHDENKRQKRKQQQYGNGSGIWQIVVDWTLLCEKKETRRIRPRFSLFVDFVTIHNDHQYEFTHWIQPQKIWRKKRSNKYEIQSLTFHWEQFETSNAIKKIEIDCVCVTEELRRWTQQVCNNNCETITRYLI